MENYSFIDQAENPSNLQDGDIILFNKEMSALCFVRGKKHLYFQMVPGREAFRHINFIREDNNFKDLAKFIGRIHGLSGEMEDGDKYLACHLQTDRETKKISPEDVIFFDTNDFILGVKRPRSGKIVFSMKIAFIKNELDFFEMANLVAVLYNCVTREIDGGEKRILSYRMVPF